MSLRHLFCRLTKSSSPRRASALRRCMIAEALEDRALLAGTAVMIEDAIPGGGIYPGSGHSVVNALTNVNGTLYFSAWDGTNGQELWRINSTGKAVMVEDAVPGGGINPGFYDSNPTNLTNVNGTLYFNAKDRTNGYELWRINASGQAVMVEDAVPGGGIRPGSFSSAPKIPDERQRHAVFHRR